MYFRNWITQTEGRLEVRYVSSKERLDCVMLTGTALGIRTLWGVWATKETEDLLRYEFVTTFG